DSRPTPSDKKGEDTGNKGDDKGSKDPDKVSFTLTSQEFRKQLVEDPKAARTMYRGNIIELTGMLKCIDFDSEGVPFLFLAGTDDGALEPSSKDLTFYTVQRDPWKKAMPGQTITLRGKGSQVAVTL